MGISACDNTRDINFFERVEEKKGRMKRCDWLITGNSQSPFLTKYRYSVLSVLRLAAKISRILNQKRFENA